MQKLPTPLTFDQLIQLALNGHHPVAYHATTSDTDVVLMNKQDFETAQKVIQLALGNVAPFMTLADTH